MLNDDKRNFVAGRENILAGDLCVSAFAFACHIIPRFCPHERSCGVHVALAQERTSRGEFTGCKLRFCAFGAHSTCSDAECVGGLRQERFRLNAPSATPSISMLSLLCQRMFHAASGSVTSLLLFRPGRKNKKTWFVADRSVPSLTRLMMLGRTWTTLVQ